MTSIIEKLKIKPIAQDKKEFSVGVAKIKTQIQDVEPIDKPDAETEISKDDIALQPTTDVDIQEPTKQEQKQIVTIVDKRQTVGYDRDNFLKKLREKGLVPHTIIDVKPSETVTKPGFIKTKKPKQIRIKDDTEIKEKPVVIKKLKGKKIKLSDKVTKGSITAFTTEKPIKIPKRREKTIIDEAPITITKIGDTNISDRITDKKPIIITAPQYYMNNRQAFIQFVNNLFNQYKDEIEDQSKEVSCEARETSGVFESMPHQKIVRDYLSLYTPYRGLLLFHGLGSGKTCSSIGIAEGLKTRNQVIIMTPASLRMNYIEQMKQCGDDLYKKNQYWEFINITTNPEYIEPLSDILNLEKEYIRKNNGAWLINITKPSNYADLEPDEKESLNNQINRMMQSKYKFINYNGLRMSHIDALSRDGEINPFDNKVVIIDEAHNFISRIVNKLNRPSSISMRLYDYLLSAKNCRIVLLTGTPIINYPNEIGILFNILRGYIKTWHIPINIKTERKINEETLKTIFQGEKMLDYIEYKPSSKTIILTKNPFGFVNVRRKIKGKDDTKYMGVKIDKGVKLTNYELPDNELYSDETFERYIFSKLSENDIDVIRTGIRIELFKALPDKLDEFKNLFVKDNGEIQNENMFKNRIIGLTSYFKSAREALMPKYKEDTDMIIEKIPMSDYQFGIYEKARQAEREQEKSNIKKQKRAPGKIDGLYDDTVSTYRIFSRAFCNFVFPPEMKRPMPNDEDTINDAVKKLNEDDIDNKDIHDRLDNPDGRYSMDDVQDIEKEVAEKEDETYERRIRNALLFLKENFDKYLTPENLATYSPKFFSLLDNIKTTMEDPIQNGLHLIYSQFRTLEGIGIFKLVLEANGFVQFKIKKNKSDEWMLDINDEDRGKPTFALYTGTETPEEKEIIRNIYNSSWQYVPSTITNELKEISRNNYYGEIIKILMITSSGAEGIDLKNIRHIHLLEPYWHPVRLEQVIGRGVRICSHKDLPEELRNVKVYLYLMTFTETQKTSDASIELRLKDLSKKLYVLNPETGLYHTIDETDKEQTRGAIRIPLTSDEALHEISSIKNEINKQLIKAVKEASIDCDIHSKAGMKEGLVCLSYGDKVSSSKMSFTPSYKNQATDIEQKFNMEMITWKAITLKLGDKKYKLRLEDDGKTKTDMVYDFDSFEQAKKVPGAQPRYLGKLVISGKTARIVSDDE
jgi:hypothetical protein